MTMTALAPIVLGARQEQFCQQILAGKTITEAYAIAYGAGPLAASANGSRLIGKDRVKARIEQLRADESAAARVTLPFLTRALYRVAAMAEGSGQASAAAQAYMGVAKLHGFLVDRVDLHATVRRPSGAPDSPDEMSEEAWLAAHVIDVTPMQPEEEQPEDGEPP
jgi:hypothetical protein